jgi:hypothetical protein
VKPHEEGAPGTDLE